MPIEKQAFQDNSLQRRTQDQFYGSLLDPRSIGDSAIHDYHVFIPIIKETTSEEITTEETTTASLDVWDMGLEWYGISYQDTNRTLRLITYEGYGYSPLSYYVACCCWTRATENYWGYDNLYQAFGEADHSYDEWMDSLGIADYAYTALEQCYCDPMYVRYCNGMAEPYDYIYYENGIYVWN